MCVIVQLVLLHNIYTCRTVHAVLLFLEKVTLCHISAESQFLRIKICQNDRVMHFSKSTVSDLYKDTHYQSGHEHYLSTTEYSSEYFR